MDVFDCYDWSVRKLTLHGSAVEIHSACEQLQPAIDHLVRPFRETGFPEGFVPVRGTIEPYDLDDILKHLPPRATALPAENEHGTELYRDGDRYFRVDESFGMIMLDPVRRRWHAWVTAQALDGDAVSLLDSVVLWPLAQLLAPRGLHLIPAVAVEKDGHGTLLLSDLSLEPELASLLQAGYRLIGQRWTALRDDEGRVSMLHLPGHVMKRAMPVAPGVPSTAAGQMQPGPQSAATPTLDLHLPAKAKLTATANAADTIISLASVDESANRHRQLPGERFAAPSWIDLLSCGGVASNHAFCGLVLLCAAGRREQIRVKEVGWAGSLNALRRAWPIGGLAPARHGGKLVSRLASRVRIAELQLSRHPDEIVTALQRVHAAPLPPHLTPPTLPLQSAMVREMVRPRRSELRQSA